MIIAIPKTRVVLFVQVTCLEAERLHQEETLNKFKDTLQTQKKDHAELCQRMGELEQAGQQLAKLVHIIQAKIVFPSQFYSCRTVSQNGGARASWATVNKVSTHAITDTDVINV